MLLRIAGLPILGSSRETKPTECVCVVVGGGVHIYLCDRERYRERNFFYFKELANAIVRADKSKVFRVSGHAGGPGKSCSSSPE